MPPSAAKCPINRSPTSSSTRACACSRPRGRLCLIQPSGFLYNLQSHGFRSGIAKTGRMLAVLDFTSVRGLYEGADPKTVAVLAGDATSREFLHLTFRRTYRTAQRIGFELDHYDRHHLSVDEVVADPKAARANLLGGGRLAAVAARLRGMRTIAEFVEGAKRGWLMGEGFIEGKHNQQAGEHLVGRPFLPTTALTNKGFAAEDLETVSATSFYRPGRPMLFEPLLVLIRENESLPVAYWDKSVLTFKHKIVGVHAPSADKEEHRRFYEALQRNHTCYRFAVMLNGSQALIGKATALLKGDIEALPYPEDEADLALTFWEQALADDTLQYVASYVRLGQQSDLLRRPADAGVLREYASLYRRLLNSLYDNLRAGDPVSFDGLTCQPFFFGTEPAIEWLGPDLRGTTGESRLRPDAADAADRARGPLLPRKRHPRHQAGSAPLLDPFHRDLGRRRHAHGTQAAGVLNRGPCKSLWPDHVGRYRGRGRAQDARLHCLGVFGNGMFVVPSLGALLALPIVGVGIRSSGFWFLKHASLRPEMAVLKNAFAALGRYSTLAAKTNPLRPSELFTM